MCRPWDCVTKEGERSRGSGLTRTRYSSGMCTKVGAMDVGSETSVIESTSPQASQHSSHSCLTPIRAESTTDLNTPTQS